MVLERTILMGQLYAIYQSLLTNKQREMLGLYYEEDFSLSEIAEHYQITRQGVHDNIQRGEKALLDYEAKLRLNQRRIRRLDLLDQLTRLDMKEIQPILNELIEMDD